MSIEWFLLTGKVVYYLNPKYRASLTDKQINSANQVLTEVGNIHELKEQINALITYNPKFQPVKNPSITVNPQTPPNSSDNESPEPVDLDTQILASLSKLEQEAYRLNNSNPMLEEREYEKQLSFFKTNVTNLVLEKEALKEKKFDVKHKYVYRYSITVYWNDLWTLTPGEWEVDTVINSFLYLIKQRSDKNLIIDLESNTITKTNSLLLSTWTHNTFFYKNLIYSFEVFITPSKSKPIYTYEKIENCTKAKACPGGIFAYDLILIPMHLGNHWAMGVINFKRKRIEYYDSLSEVEKINFFEFIKKYIIDEYRKSHPGQIFDFKGWITDYTLGKTKGTNNFICPQQKNGYDCGEFACRFAEYVSRGRAFDFTTKDMINFRRQHLVEILDGKLLEEL